MIDVPRLLVAAPASGQGKTTWTLALVARLRAAGLRVAPFKVGPDYLDPTHLGRAAGRPCRNLDPFLLKPPLLTALFARATRGRHTAEVAIVEGVMGLFDGIEPTSDRGSSAEVAALLGLPVVLVVDAWAAARTVAAVVHGLHTFHPQLRLRGVLLNRVGGAEHAALCTAAIEQATGLPVLGWLPHDPELALPERHLGLVRAEELSLPLDRLAARAVVNLDAVLALARAAPPLPEPPALPLPPPPPRPIRIGRADDAAFHFYYADALDLLEDMGAEWVPFSPLADDALPAGLDAVYLGGGYPELYAAELSARPRLFAALRRHVAAGRTLVAECGGLMFLSEALVDLEGRRFPMAGLVPGTSRMLPRLRLGYREAEALRPSPLADRGWTVRGHEFHHSVLEPPPAEPAYRWRNTQGVDGVVLGPRNNALASYLHVHLASDLRLAARWLSCSLEADRAAP